MDLSIGDGVFALLGPNGSGKTTFMRAVMGLIARMDGRIAFGDDDLTNLPAHRRAGLGIGYMPEERGLYPRLGVRWQLAYLGRIHGMDSAAAGGREVEVTVPQTK